MLKELIKQQGKYSVLRLLLRVINPDLVPPEWVMIVAIAGLFIWGFSKRNLVELPSETREEELISVAEPYNRDRGNH